MRKSLILGAVVSAFLAGPVLANDLQTGLTTWELVETVKDDGTLVVEKISPDSVVPQDRIQIIADLVNNGEEAVEDVVFILNIDPSVTLSVDEIDYDLVSSVLFATYQAPQSFLPFNDLTTLEESGETRPATEDEIGFIQVSVSRIEPAKNVKFAYSATVK